MTKTRGPTKKELRQKILEDLKAQLLKSGKVGQFYDDILEDYMYLLDLRDKLRKDIKKNGLRKESMSGNGFAVEKDNASINNLLKVNSQMLKILDDLDLKEPDIKTIPQELGDDFDDLLSRN